MAGFDLDLGFEVAELAAGITRVLATRGIPAARLERGNRVLFEATIDGCRTYIEICPAPEQPGDPPRSGPRSLVTAEGDAPLAAVETLRKAVLFAFQRARG